jgi:uncharacterized membrane protein
MFARTSGPVWFLESVASQLQPSGTSFFIRQLNYHFWLNLVIVCLSGLNFIAIWAAAYNIRQVNKADTSGYHFWLNR